MDSESRRHHTHNVLDKGEKLEANWFEQTGQPDKTDLYGAYKS